MLAQGSDVVAVLSPSGSTARVADIVADITVVRADLSSAELDRLVIDARPDTCIHLAWYVDPHRYLTATQENLAALVTGVRLLAALDAASCPRTVLAGTCLEGVEAAGVVEGATEEPIYAAAKGALHRVGMRLSVTAVACAHIFSLYGPGEKGGRVVPQVIRACLEGRPIDVSSGEQERDFLHVEDVAAGIVSLANTDLRGGIDICSGKAIQLREVFGAIAAATGRPDLINLGALQHAPGEPRRIAGDNTVLRGTGWQVTRTLRDGVRETVDWWRSELHLEGNS